MRLVHTGEFPAQLRDILLPATQRSMLELSTSNISHLIHIWMACMDAGVGDGCLEASGTKLEMMQGPRGVTLWWDSPKAKEQG